ncbi:MAG TPA: nicotinate-nucleotide adenylyltransferase [Baekduia sp.]|nr:nicotinate-nucleotide adenylyltransferase [Baekduia sp.]
MEPVTSANPQRIGVFGGSFNPPHIGHLLCAQAAVDALSLEKVLFVPARVPPHKELADDPGAEVRASLVGAAIASDPRFELSRVELEREGPSFTVDTLRALAHEYPGTELCLILGGDMALSFHSWREPETILKLARLAVVEREDIDDDSIRRALAGLGRARISFFEMPRCDISSTAIRRRAATGRSLRYYVPDAVAEEIRTGGHYRLS